jgi:hypothetical protein
MYRYYQRSNSLNRLLVVGVRLHNTRHQVWAIDRNDPKCEVVNYGVKSDLELRSFLENMTEKVEL